jgi:cytochrome c biogenesis protein CcdA
MNAEMQGKAIDKFVDVWKQSDGWPCRLGVSLESSHRGYLIYEKAICRRVYRGISAVFFESPCSMPVLIALLAIVARNINRLL